MLTPHTKGCVKTKSKNRPNALHLSSAFLSPHMCELSGSCGKTIAPLQVAGKGDIKTTFKDNKQHSDLSHTQ